MNLETASQKRVGKALLKALGRLPLISHNFLFSLLPSICSFVISYVVVRTNGTAVWGEYVHISLVISLMVLVAQWAQKDYLLRDFSFNPAAIVRRWYSGVVPRLGILFVALLANFFIFSGETALFGAGWLTFLWAGRMAEVIYVFQKRFNSLLKAEVIHWIAICVVLAACRPHLSLRILLAATLIGSAMKALALYWGIRQIIFPKPTFEPDRHFITRSLSFFALALTGLLEARLDFLCIILFSGKAELGKYSLLFNLLLLLKNLPGFIIEPFAKNLYRADQKVFNRLNNQLGIAGLGVAVSGVLTIRYLCEWSYYLHYSWLFYGGAMLYVWPRFLFSMDIYRLFQQRKEQVMVAGTWLGLAVNAGLNGWWLKSYGLESVIFSAATGQWVMLVFFKAGVVSGLCRHCFGHR